MVKAFSLLLCAACASWLVYTFGFGLFVAVSAIAGAAILLSGGQAPEPKAAKAGQSTSYRTTGWTGF